MSKMLYQLQSQLFRPLPADTDINLLFNINVSGILPDNSPSVYSFIYLLCADTSSALFSFPGFILSIQSFIYTCVSCLYLCFGLSVMLLTLSYMSDSFDFAENHEGIRVLIKRQKSIEITRPKFSI